jgi:hypothetical protein
MRRAATPNRPAELWQVILVLVGAAAAAALRIGQIRRRHRREREIAEASEDRV